eukprot:2518422-Rhodomonas_salina.1
MRGFSASATFSEGDFRVGPGPHSLPFAVAFDRGPSFVPVSGCTIQSCVLPGYWAQADNSTELALHNSFHADRVAPGYPGGLPLGIPIGVALWSRPILASGARTEGDSD